MYLLFNEIELAPLSALLKRIKKAVLLTHVYPDGDAVGALQGFAGFLRALGMEVHAIVPSPYPAFLAFLDKDPLHKIKVYKHDPQLCRQILQAADAVFCLDINMLSRLDAVGNSVKRLSKPKVLIDHHPNPVSKEFDMVFSRPELSSSCELVYRLICQLNMLADFPPAIARPLYVGLMTDTNNFANSVTAETFEVAAALLHLGVCKEEVQQQVFGAFSEGRMRLMGHAVCNRMVLVKPYPAAYMMLSMSEQARFGFRPGDTEGFVNIPLHMAQVDISILFVETPEFIRVSLRSRNSVDVNEIARRFFNGGGHRQAAGGRLYCSFAELPAKILQALEEIFGPIIADK
ncbi:MAG: bifunctional oligoribonuclease/PAP phosphatase NrnA [Bacteroidales bacterium]|nr:bifunctional oligoribonuclease/PAP phosphatase NrnA [Bacteroidales bacterium]